MLSIKKTYCHSAQRIKVMLNCLLDTWKKRKKKRQKTTKLKNSCNEFKYLHLWLSKLKQIYTFKVSEWNSVYSRFNVLAKWKLSGKPFTSKHVCENLTLTFSYKNKFFLFKVYLLDYIPKNFINKARQITLLSWKQGLDEGKGND